MSDNNNNNNDNNKDKIEYWDNILKGLDDKSRPNIVSIAKEAGIAVTSYAKTDEVIEKIKRVVKRNRYMFEQEELLGKSNPFNTVSQLANKDVDQHEFSFWRVFKNKFIFKHIMSNMNQIPYLSRSYDSIVSVENMIKSNQFCMLKDKIKRRKHLHFKQYDYGIFSGIFSGVKHESDSGFYTSLFKNYTDQVSLMVHYKNDLLKVMIKSKCIIAIKEFLNHFQIKPDVDLLLYAIKCGSIKVIEYFLNGFDFINENPEIPFNINSNITVDDPDYSLFKYKLYVKKPTIPEVNTIKYQISKNEINNFIVSSSNSLIKPFKKLYYLIETKKLVFMNDQIKSDLKSTIKINPIESTLIELILFYKLQDLQTQQLPPIDLFEFSTLDSSFSKQQLKSKLNDPINFKSVNLEIIVKLLDYYYSYATQTQKCIQYYHYYQNGQTNLYKPILGSEITESDAIFALECGCFEIFSRYVDQNHYYSFSKTMALTGKPKLFSKCIENKEKKLSFLESFINGVKLRTYKNRPLISDYFGMLTELDDLELIKYFTNEIGKDNISISSTRFPNKIKSIDMMDYLFNEFNYLFANQYGTFAWYNYNYLEIVIQNQKLTRFNDYFHVLNINQNDIHYFFGRMKSYFQSEQTEFEQLLSIANHIVNSPQNYSLNEDNVKSIIDHFHDSGLLYESLIMNIVINTSLKMDITQIFNGHSPASFFKIFKWMKLNYNDEFKIGGRFHYQRCDSNLNFYIENGLLDQPVIDLIFKNDSKLNNSIKIGIQGSIKLLSKLISIDNSFINDPVFLSKLISAAIVNGQLEIIKWIHLNHKHVFLQKKKTASQGVFSLIELRNFVEQSVKTDNVLITEFLKDSIYITDKMFRDYSVYNYFTLNYFIDKKL